MSQTTRREFIKLLKWGLSALGLATLAAPIVAFFYPKELAEMPTEQVLLCKEAELPPETSKTVRFGRYPALVINTSGGLKAYSAVCTHFACLVAWNPSTGRIECPCHDGFFDPLDGHVIAGPPPEPLLSLPVNVVDGQIYVGGEG